MNSAFLQFGWYASTSILKNFSIAFVTSSSIDLPNITAEVYCSELSNRIRSFMVACPPAGPSPPVVDLLIATADFQQDLASWKIR
jgi:hypothetical protein